MLSLCLMLAGATVFELLSTGMALANWLEFRSCSILAIGLFLVRQL